MQPLNFRCEIPICAAIVQFKVVAELEIGMEDFHAPATLSFKPMQWRSEREIVVVNQVDDAVRSISDDYLTIPGIVTKQDLPEPNWMLLLDGIPSARYCIHVYVFAKTADADTAVSYLGPGELRADFGNFSGTKIRSSPAAASRATNRMTASGEQGHQDQ